MTGRAIYAFTGASVSNILNFRDVFPGAEQLILNLNYRSTPEILRACQNLIRHNVRKIEKELRTDNASGEDVIVLESSSEETEALAVMSEIRDLVERKGYAYTDIAVLYRCNFQSRWLEECFLQHKSLTALRTAYAFTTDERSKSCWTICGSSSIQIPTRATRR